MKSSFASTSKHHRQHRQNFYIHEMVPLNSNDFDDGMGKTLWLKKVFLGLWKNHCHLYQKMPTWINKRERKKEKYSVIIMSPSKMLLDESFGYMACCCDHKRSCSCKRCCQPTKDNNRLHWKRNITPGAATNGCCCCRCCSIKKKEENICHSCWSYPTTTFVTVDSFYSYILRTSPLINQKKISLLILWYFLKIVAHVSWMMMVIDWNLYGHYVVVVVVDHDLDTIWIYYCSSMYLLHVQQHYMNLVNIFFHHHSDCLQVQDVLVMPNVHMSTIILYRYPKKFKK